MPFVFPYRPFELEAKYAVQIRIAHARFPDWWKDIEDEQLLLSVSGKHGLSGLTGSENQIFYNSAASIVSGRFVTGRHLKVV